MKMSDTINVLWLAPNLNHYKVRFLNRLQENGWVSLHLLCGEIEQSKGYASFTDVLRGEVSSVSVRKKQMGRSLKVLMNIFSLQRQKHFDWIMIPAETKFLPLLTAVWLGRFFLPVRLFSYNHAVAGSAKKSFRLSWLMYRMFDRIVFYTEHEKEKALALHLLPPRKAFFANNTLDGTEIARHSTFQIRSLADPAILFIGRLIPNKNIPLLLAVYRELRKTMPQLKLLIIGDGLEADTVRRAVAENNDIEWFGALSDESKIAPVMARANIVCNLGASGLSIMHAFLYGKPYVAMERPDNGPECWYLCPGENGLMLSGGGVEDVAQIQALLSDRVQYENFCRAAAATAQKYSMEAWVKEMQHCLNA